MIVSIRHGDHEFELSWCDLLRQITRISDGLHMTAGVIHGLHTGGLTDIQQDSEIMLGTWAQYRAINEAIVDEPLRALHLELATRIMTLVEVDRKMTRWIMEFLLIPEEKLATTRRQATLSRRITKRRYSGEPSWVDQDGFKAMVEESQLAFKRILETRRDLIARAEALLERCQAGSA